jgi:uncharacterized protein (TIGR00661 family)
MKILYGVQLNGNGHITRSLEIVNELIELGHSVDIVSSGNKSSLKIKTLKSFKGIDLYYTPVGKVNWIKTIYKSDIISLLKDIKKIKEYDLVISDFEPISAWSAKISNIKSIGVANQYSLLDNKIGGFLLTKLFIKYFAPCDYYIKLDYKSNYQPIIRREILQSEVKFEDFYLIYLPNIRTNRIIEVISNNNNNNWKIYTNDIDFINKNKNIKIIQPNAENFMNDLISCRGVITQSGFSTTSECLVMGKKMWSIPIEGQYEQIYNSIQLNKMGIFTKKFTKKNLEKWLKSNISVIYEWENPITKIVKKIIQIGEN